MRTTRSTSGYRFKLQYDYLNGHLSGIKDFNDSNVDRRSSSSEQSAIASATDRGFTGHERLDGVSLIHMNGRVYDPVIGRFASPDPTIPDPLNTQSYNRYSYVNNNPLTFTDPSGFDPERNIDVEARHDAQVYAYARRVMFAGGSLPSMWEPGMTGMRWAQYKALSGFRGAGGELKLETAAEARDRIDAQKKMLANRAERRRLRQAAARGQVTFTTQAPLLMACNSCLFTTTRVVDEDNTVWYVYVAEDGYVFPLSVFDLAGNPATAFEAGSYVVPEYGSDDDAVTTFAISEDLGEMEPRNLNPNWVIPGRNPNPQPISPLPVQDDRNMPMPGDIERNLPPIPPIEG